METKLGQYTLTTRPLKNYEQTVEEIKRLSKKYWQDLLENNKFGFDFKNAKIPEAHNFVKNLTYVKDPAGHEFTSRPKISLALANSEICGKRHYLDCDDKAILILAYFFLQNDKISGRIHSPYMPKIVCSGRKTRPHHVYPIISLAGIYDKYVVDATYPHNILGKTLFEENFHKEFDVF